MLVPQKIEQPTSRFRNKSIQISKLPLWKGRRSSNIDLWYLLPIPFRGNNLVRSFMTYHNIIICETLYKTSKLPNFRGRTGPGLAHILRMYFELGALNLLTVTEPVSNNRLDRLDRHSNSNFYPFEKSTSLKCGGSRQEGPVSGNSWPLW